MLTIPSALWPYLMSSGWRPVEVYEIEAFGGRSALYYSARDVTWGGHSYTGLTVRRTPIRQQMDFFVPDCTVKFGNATNILRSYLAPDDTLTGARMTIRLLVEKPDASIETDSLVLFRGVIDPPKLVTAEEFPLVVRGLVDGRGAECPGRRMAIPCGWAYANQRTFDGSGHCSYQYNTTASGSGAASTALTLASTTAVGAGTNSTALTLAAANGFRNGDYIKVGSGEPVTIQSGGGTTSIVLDEARSWSNGNTVVSYFANGDEIQIAGGTAVVISSGAGTASLTLASARTWSNGATIRHSDCQHRSHGECRARGMLHRHGGNPSVAQTSRLATIGRLFVNRPTNSQSPGQPTPPYIEYRKPGEVLRGTSYASPGDPMPVGYGRRRVGVRVLETSTTQSPNRLKPQLTSFHSLGSGPIDSVQNYFLDERRTGDTFRDGDKQIGIYIRLGDVGVNDPETQAEYVADPTTQVRDQNIDFRNFGRIAYSEQANICFVQDRGGPNNDPTLMSVDGKWRLLQKYLANGSADGSPAWDCSPIWESADWLSSDTYGMRLPVSDIDMAVAKPEADYAATLITSSEASTSVTTAQASASTTCKVKSSEGFILGRRVDVNGVANTVAGIPSAVEIKLGTAVTQSVGHTVVQRPQRFESHIFIDTIDRGTRWLMTLMETCRGYITYDNGKVQLRVERNHCIERLTDGGLDVWTSTTNLTYWSENLGSGQLTVNRDTGLAGSSGPYSARLDRTGSSNFGGILHTSAGYEPGRWYRIVFLHKQSATGIGNANRLRIRNTTQNLGCSSDGYTWATAPATDPIDATGSTSVTQYEFTFKTREDFAVTDTIEIALCPYFTVGAQVWYDEVHLRGPYAGDFREFTDAKLMGWKDGSFAWSIDNKDRETNRVIVAFNNESGMFGADEAIVNDFVHQETHVPKEIRYDIPAICDRDQATRIASFRLAKRRDLGPGSQFTGTPAALALQPGDVILVSDTVPGWTREEQRVTAVDILGIPDSDQFFVQIKTEDYDETIYADTGPAQQQFPTSADASVLVTVARNSGGVLDLTMVLSDQQLAAVYFDIHMSDTTGFEPDPGTRIGRTQSSRFTFTPSVDDLDVMRYFQVVAVTDRGEIQSGEFATTIYRSESTLSGYTGDYRYPTVLQNPDPGSSAGTYSGSGGSATIANINDKSDADYNTGSSSATGPSKNGDDDSIRYHTFGDGSSGHIGRPVIRAKKDGTGPISLASVDAWYTLDRTAGSPTWVKFATVTATAFTDYVGPELSSVDFAKFAIRIRNFMSNGGMLDRTANDAHATVAFDHKT